MEKSIDITSYFFIDGTVFIIWHWEWQEDFSSDEDDRTSITVIPETPSISDSENSDDDSTTNLTASLSLLTTGDTVITHAVTFKCIGSTKETQYQEALSSAAARLNRGEAVLCQVLPEPNNPIDSEAICIQFKLDRKWYKVGYVIHEALSDLHTALRESKVTKVSIDWIKYIIYWRTPGWYTGINITRIGEWSSTVVRSQSANVCRK